MASLATTNYSTKYAAECATVDDTFQTTYVTSVDAAQHPAERAAICAALDASVQSTHRTTFKAALDTTQCPTLSTA